jgi:type II secretory pathway component PulJ
MSEFKSSILGVIIVLALFALISVAMTRVFNNTLETIEVRESSVLEEV